MHPPKHRTNLTLVIERHYLKKMAPHWDLTPLEDKYDLFFGITSLATYTFKQTRIILCNLLATWDFVYSIFKLRNLHAVYA